eukprot:10993133-Lingulodinium_polyedra.AAC.1
MVDVNARAARAGLQPRSDVLQRVKERVGRVKKQFTDVSGLADARQVDRVTQEVRERAEDERRRANY